MKTKWWYPPVGVIVIGGLMFGPWWWFIPVGIALTVLNRIESYR